MSEKQHIRSAEGLPPAVGPYSLAVQFGNHIQVSGQLGLTAEGKLIDGGIGPETAQALQNIDAILRACNANLNDVTRIQVLLSDINDFAAMNAEYARAFSSEEAPARATSEAKLPKGARVELIADAYREIDAA